jgi:hypothetical protein
MFTLTMTRFRSGCGRGGRLPAGHEQPQAHRTPQFTSWTQKQGIGLNALSCLRIPKILATESGDIIVAEFVQGYLNTQAGDQLVTEAGDGNEPLVTQVQPAEDYNGYALETEAYTAAPGYDPQVMLRWSDDARAYLVKRTLELDG